MKKYKLIILFKLLVLSKNIFAKILITTSIAPIASIIAPIVQDIADINIINNNNGCPHDFELKLSDVKKLEKTDLLIFISPKFEAGFEKLANKYHFNSIIISEIEGINFEINGKINWHFWYNLDNVTLLTEKLSLKLAELYPAFKENFEINKKKFLLEIEVLKKYKSQKLNNYANIIVANHAIEHFFTDLNSKLYLIPELNNISLKKYNLIKKEASSNLSQIIVIDSSQNDKLYEKFGKKIIKANFENWKFLGKKGNIALNKYFVNEYSKIIDQFNYSDLH